MFEKLKPIHFFGIQKLSTWLLGIPPQISNAIAQGETATVITTSFGNR